MPCSPRPATTSQKPPAPGPWFDAYRRGVADSRESCFGADLVAAVTAAEVDHEILSHSFTHPFFTDISRSVADAVCRLTRTYGERYGLERTSFVFPRTRIAHRKALADNVFRCYSGPRPYPLSSVQGLRGAATLACPQPALSHRRWSRPAPTATGSSSSRRRCLSVGFGATPGGPSGRSPTIPPAARETLPRPRPPRRGHLPPLATPERPH